MMKNKLRFKHNQPRRSLRKNQNLLRKRKRRKNLLLQLKNLHHRRLKPSSLMKAAVNLKASSKSFTGRI
jgi:hypothetical protein